MKIGLRHYYSRYAISSRFAFPLTRGAGHRSGAEYHGLSSARAFRCQDRADTRRESGHLGSYIFALTANHIDLILHFQSLGCTLFALAYSHSPFENTQTTEQGGSIAMAVLNAQYKHPQSAYSQGLRNLIDAMLKVNPAERPDINEVSIGFLKDISRPLTTHALVHPAR